MSSTALIFGAGGQDGFYMARLLADHGIKAISISRNGTHVQADVADRDLVEDLIKAHGPDYVLHFAAESSTRHGALFENHDTIATGAVNVLEAVRRHAPTARVFITGSGVQFRNEGEPISEFHEFHAGSPYAVARIHSVYAARYFRSLGIRAYVGYLFHHESPLRKPQHVAQKIALAARRIGAMSRETLEIGDTSVEKEWTYAGDVVAGIFRLMTQDNVFEATIGSGVTHSIEDWLELCFGLVGHHWRDHVRLTEGFAPEYPRLVSDPATIRSLGWRPVTGIQALARMMVHAPAEESHGR